MTEQRDTPVIEYGTARRANYAAVASFVFGLMFFVPILAGVAAILLGLQGMRAAREKSISRYVIARRGLALGILNIALTLIIGGAFALHEYHVMAPIRRYNANLREISLAMLLYSNSHRGQYPPTFDELVTSGELPKGSPVFACPGCSGGFPAKAATVGSVVTSDYVMAPPWNPMPKDFRTLGNLPEHLIYVFEPLTNHGGRGIHVPLSDGNVVWLDQPLASKVLADLQRGQNPPPSWK